VKYRCPVRGCTAKTCPHHKTHPHPYRADCFDAGFGKPLGCKACVPVRPKRKAKASGLPTQEGWYPWKRNPQCPRPTAILYVTDSGHVYVPKPDESRPEGFFLFHAAGRTVRDIGGVFGKKVAE
jgi:hypothetical protein